MKSVEIPTIPIVLGFCLTYLALGAAAEEKDSGSLVVTGNVFCDVCAEGRLSENGYGISGASVTLECIFNRKTLTVSVRGETDENGEFKMELPSNIFQSADQLSKCSVKPLKSPNKSCRISSKSRPSSLELQSFDNGVLTYSAGSFSYRPETVRAECNKKDFLRMTRGRGMAEVVQETSINPAVEFLFRHHHHHKSSPSPAPSLSPNSPPGSPGLSPQPAHHHHHHKSPPSPAPNLSPNSPPGSPGLSPQPAHHHHHHKSPPYGSPGLSPLPADAPLPDDLLPPIPGGVPIAPSGPAPRSAHGPRYD